MRKKIEALSNEDLLTALKTFLSEELERYFSIIQKSQESAKELEFIRLSEAMRMLGAGRATFDRWQRADSEYYIPDFPKKIRVGGYVFYEKSEIQAFMQKRIDSREQGGEQC